jgi:aminomethyltransferase
MTTSSTLKKTALFEAHQNLKARIVPFAGYEMPVQYPKGLVTEHMAVRNKAGLFDVSHMGILKVSGPDV